VSLDIIITRTDNEENATNFILHHVRYVKHFSKYLYIEYTINRLRNRTDNSYFWRLYF